RPLRQMAIYAASSGFELVEELDYLCARTIEPNIFFNPHFLAPAMPRLEDREVRLAVIRDGDEFRNRLRLLVPFSVEKPAIPLAVPVMRTWANPFAPLGTPLIDRDDPIGVTEAFFAMLARPRLKLPKVLMLPARRLDGPVAATPRTMSEAGGSARITPDETTRPFIDSKLDGDAYLRNTLSKHHFDEYARLRRRLSEQGELVHSVARGPEEVRPAVEDFLALEASGWKGRKRTAMAIDRFQA